VSVLKRVWGWLLTALAILAAGAGALLLWRRYRTQQLTHQDRVEIEQARKDVAAIKAERDKLTASADEHHQAVLEIDRELEEIRNRGARVLRRGKPRTEQEMYDALNRLGL